nr:2-phosphosulfolactate phosphatase [Deinobacterium chartae]
MRVDLLPYGSYSDTVLVVDVLRATTTAAVFLEQGASEVRFTASLEAALEQRGEGIVLAGERGGLPIPDFDLGNSPLEASGLNFTGRTVVMNTTNGTTAAHAAAASGKHVILASLRNAHAAARRARSLAVEEIAIVCAGREGRSGLDDVYTAGVLCEYLLAMGEWTLDDGARIALTVRRQVGDPLEPLAGSAAGESLERVGLGQDVQFCARISESTVVPVLAEHSELGLIFRS